MKFNLIFTNLFKPYNQPAGSFNDQRMQPNNDAQQIDPSINSKQISDIASDTNQNSFNKPEKVNENKAETQPNGKYISYFLK